MFSLCAGGAGVVVARYDLAAAAPLGYPLRRLLAVFATFVLGAVVFVGALVFF